MSNEKKEKEEESSFFDEELLNNKNQNKANSYETLSLENDSSDSKNSFFSDLNKNEKQFMSNILASIDKKRLKVKIDFTEPEIDNKKKTYILKENIKLLNKVITEKLNEIINEDNISTKETNNIEPIQLLKRKKKRK